MAETWARPSMATAVLLRRVQNEVLDRYRQLGDPVAVVGTGSRVMGFTDNADLDVTVVWDEVPDHRQDVLDGLADRDRGVRAFDQPGFQLESFYLTGEQVDVMHRRVTDLTGWWAQLCAGDGWQLGLQPLPVVALSGLRYGLVICGDIEPVLPDLTTLPETFATAIGFAAHGQVKDNTPFLSAAADNGDGWLLHHLLTQPLHAVYVSFFAQHGHLFPFAKRLAQWTDRLGLDPRFAQLDQQLWATADLSSRLKSFHALAELVTAPGRPGS